MKIRLAVFSFLITIILCVGGCTRTEYIYDYCYTYTPLYYSPAAASVEQTDNLRINVKNNRKYMYKCSGD